MLAHLLPSAVTVLLVFIAWRLGRRGSTQTQVAGDRVTLQALKADIAELQARMAKIDAKQGRLHDIGDQTAREMNIITQVLETHFTTDQHRNEQEWSAGVCSTGGHYIRPRIHN